MQQVPEVPSANVLAVTQQYRLLNNRQLHVPPMQHTLAQ
jgi:hypothetical protein